MTIAAREILTGVRLSELAACPRRCACRAIGHEAAEPTVQQQRYMTRGQLFEAYVAAQFEAKYGKADIERQRVIPWPLGEGHADLFVKSEKLIVEVFSSTGSDISHKIRQCKRYVHFDPEARAGAVYVVDPSSLDREDLFPVLVTDEDVEQIEWEVGVIADAMADKDRTRLPACVHDNPSGCRHSGCPFYATAWEDWTPPDPTDAPELTDLAAAFYEAKKQRAVAQGQVEVTEGEYARAKEALCQALVDPKTTYRAGPFEVSRTPVRGKVTFSYAKACESGVVNPAMQDLLAPFVKIGQGHDLVNLRVVGEPTTGGGGDFGEVPFR